MDKWIRVIDHMAEKMPEDDCLVWVTRVSSFNEVWVQTIEYYKEDNRFTWDGVVAWMPYQENKPQPYDCSYYYAGKPRKFKVID